MSCGSVDLRMASAETRATSCFEWQDGKLKVRFYGKLADLFGSERDVPIDAPCTVAELRRRLAIDHPHAAEPLQNKRVRACVGDAIIGDEDIVPRNEVLDLLAPVSGG